MISVVSVISVWFVCYLFLVFVNSAMFFELLDRKHLAQLNKLIEDTMKLNTASRSPLRTPIRVPVRQLVVASAPLSLRLPVGSLCRCPIVSKARLAARPPARPTGHPPPASPGDNKQGLQGEKKTESEEK